ncbi:MAG: hypothetical protein DI582_02360 [Azospirillum brasilense]|nr:MAG: hypothetical protein DI582_02360 [Azospirillum brasilense]
MRRLNSLQLLVVTTLLCTGPSAFAQSLDTLPAVAPAVAPGDAPVATSLPEVNVPSVPAQPLPPVEQLAPAEPAAAQPLPPVEPLPPEANATVAPPVDTGLPAVPEQPAPATPAPPPSVDMNEPFSYGEFPYSLMYSPNQIENMKRVLKTYETKRRLPGAADIEVVEEERPQLVITPEPDAYPVFTLASIVYRARNDWSVWISGMRITPKTNDQTLKVVGIGPDMVRFVWKPEYVMAMKRRAEADMFAKTDAVKHKLTKPNTAMLDTQADQVMFTLKPNQTFAPGYMATFEGRVAAPTLEKIAEPTTAEQGTDMPALVGETPPTDGAAPTEVQRDSLPDAATTGLAGDAIQRMYQKAGGASAPSAKDSLDTLLKSSEGIKSVTPVRQRQPTNP